MVTRIIPALYIGFSLTHAPLAFGQTPIELLELCNLKEDTSSKHYFLQAGRLAGYNNAVIDHALSNGLVCAPAGTLFNVCYSFKKYVYENGSPGKFAFPYAVEALARSYPCEGE